MDHADRSLSAALRTDLLWAGQALKCQNQLTGSFARKKKILAHAHYSVPVSGTCSQADNLVLNTFFWLVLSLRDVLELFMINLFKSFSLKKICDQI